MADVFVSYARSDKARVAPLVAAIEAKRSEEHTSELQSRSDLVCRLLLEKKKKKHQVPPTYTRHTSKPSSFRSLRAACTRHRDQWPPRAYRHERPRLGPSPILMRTRHSR